jgi:hypothetical protein
LANDSNDGWHQDGGFPLREKLALVTGVDCLW